ncbi:hypothetical protein [Nocardioides sp.]|uniref:hypothetical protein n=1 Tax=Nocardioides sp. TaxID=35761 RepID=UPI002BB16B37|nr:hypothetical protein [Nocardioides sp.]HXH78192.1 hypothetical protein [Nocardioides sp.]
MEIHCDYFRATGDETARETHARPGGPLHPDSGAGVAFDGVATQAIFDSLHLEQFVTLARGVSFDRRPKSHGLWPPSNTPPSVDETSLWQTDPSVERLDTQIRDGLADINPARAPELADVWIVVADIGLAVPRVIDAVVDLTALARRAREGQEQVYCWSILAPG